ncbi:major allergen Pru ar 1-like [Papaver somniferum]|uniref:major allergen Pru ar 1-like n=1 Tax=Papaver somniferum TaxID=3469 RepID=UPI000E6F5F89|nr:major allergen Pru ar 1-like [Papaver somniferum]
MACITFDETLHCTVSAHIMFHAMFLDAHNLMPKVMPHAVKSVDFVSGDGGFGSIQQVNFFQDWTPKAKTTSIECNYTVIESDAFSNKVDHISNKIKFEIAHGGGCICKSKISYYLKAGAVLNEDELKVRRESSKGLYKIVQDYLVKNPDVYA